MRFLSRCLSVEPADRPGSAEEALQEEWLQDPNSPKSPASAGGKKKKDKKRDRLGKGTNAILYATERSVGLMWDVASTGG